jgi:hypothetical protein
MPDGEAGLSAGIAEAGSVPSIKSKGTYRVIGVNQRRRVVFAR